MSTLPLPNTHPVTLSRSDRRTQLRAFYGAPLRLQIASPWALDGVLELRAEIHNQRRLSGQAPLIASSTASPSGYDAVINFTWGQMCLPLMGQGQVTLYLLIRAILEDGTPDVYELGTFEVLSNPASDINPPEVTAEAFATTAALADVASRVNVLEEGGMGSLATYADNAAAVTGGLAVGTIYQTPTGEIRIVVPAPSSGLQWSDGTDAQWSDGTGIEIPDV